MSIGENSLGMWICDISSKLMKLISESLYYLADNTRTFYIAGAERGSATVCAVPARMRGPRPNSQFRSAIYARASRSHAGRSVSAGAAVNRGRRPAGLHILLFGGRVSSNVDRLICCTKCLIYTCL